MAGVDSEASQRHRRLWSEELGVRSVVALLINVPYYLIAAPGWRPRAQAYVRMRGDVGLLTAGLFDAGGIVAFNLLILNVVGVMTAWLAERYRRSRREVRALYGELERAHDAAQRLTGGIQRTSRLYALGEVVAGITHEMRNVMMAARSHSHLLRRRLRDADGEVLGHAHQTERSLITASRILNNVLETARQPSTERMRVSPAEVLGRVVELKRVNLPPAVPAVMVVPFQLEQVLLNLVSNPHDAPRGVREGAVITIAGHADGERVAIEVRDNGAGIPLTALPRIFEPFFTTKTSGTGLGLAISVGIVRDAGGELTAANAPEGGAVFRVALPVAS